MFKRKPKAETVTSSDAVKIEVEVDNSELTDKDAKISALGVCIAEILTLESRISSLKSELIEVTRQREVYRRKA